MRYDMFVHPVGATAKEKRVQCLRRWNPVYIVKNGQCHIWRNISETEVYHFQIIQSVTYKKWCYVVLFWIIMTRESGSHVSHDKCWMANLPTSFQPLYVTNCYPKTLVRPFTLNFLANGNFVSINHYRWSPITYFLKCSRKRYLYLFHFTNDFFITL